jgi:serine protease inhibitor
VLRRLLPLLITCSLIAAACAPSAEPDTGDAEDDPGPGDAAADPARPAAQLVVDLADDDAASVGRAVNAFGFDLLAQLPAADETTITSPLSVATMLAMVLAGAGGDTAAAMAEVLHLDDPRDVRIGALLDRLTDTDEVTLSVANALWAGRGVPFEDDYTRFARDVFDARVQDADLGDPATAAEIDSWVQEQTEGLIDGIAADLGLPDPEVVLVLLNAVYFLGDWQTQFDPDRTGPHPFALPDGSQVDVPTMALAGQRFGYAEGDGFRMLRLPYGESGRFGMEIVLPDGELGPVLAGMDVDAWAAAVEQLSERRVDLLALPSFELAWEAALPRQLSAMGMGQALSPGADFSPMTSHAVFLDSVVHKTFIRVDEQGTEAAAVTGGGMRTTSVPADLLTFEVDRPFAFTISDRDTGTILFLGTVTDPRG